MTREGSTIAFIITLAGILGVFGSIGTIQMGGDLLLSIGTGLGSLIILYFGVQYIIEDLKEKGGIDHLSK
jgi:hypothetical protein